MRQAAMSALKQQKAAQAEPARRVHGGDYVPPHKRTAEGQPSGGKPQKASCAHVGLARALLS